MRRSSWRRIGRQVNAAIDGALEDLSRELAQAERAETNGERALAIVNAELAKVRLASLVSLRRRIRNHD